MFTRIIIILFLTKNIRYIIICTFLYKLFQAIQINLLLKYHLLMPFDWLCYYETIFA